eukprot:gene42031-51312_t
MISSSLAWRQPYVNKSQVLGWWWVNKVSLNPALQPHRPEASAETSTALAQNLRVSLMALQAKYISSSTGKVDYKSLLASTEYSNFLKLTQQLPYIDLTTLSNSEKKAFFINLYNALAMHGIALKSSEIGFYRTLRSRLTFFAETSYNIGGSLYSLNDIENGILRGNKPSPVPLSDKPFGDTDPRLAHVLPCDPRIHFALNCGAASCPPIAFYSPDQLEQQLDLATANYLQETVRFFLSKRTLFLPQLFRWYLDDFGKDRYLPYRLYAFVIKHLAAARPEMAKDMQLTTMRKAKYFVEYQPYDWSLNAV